MKISQPLDLVDYVIRCPMTQGGLVPGIPYLTKSTELPPSIHIWATGIVPLSYHPNNPSPPWSSHHGYQKAPCWHLNSTLRGSHVHWTPQQSVRPKVDPWSWQFTVPPQTCLYPEFWQSSTPCSSVFTWPPVRVFSLWHPSTPIWPKVLLSIQADSAAEAYVISQTQAWVIISWSFGLIRPLLLGCLQLREVCPSNCIVLPDAVGTPQLDLWG